MFLQKINRRPCFGTRTCVQFKFWHPKKLKRTQNQDRQTKMWTNPTFSCQALLWNKCYSFGRVRVSMVRYRWMIYRPRVKPFCEGPIPRVVAPGHSQRLSCQMKSGVSLFKASKPTNENLWRLVCEDLPICRAWRASGKWPRILLWTPIPSQFFSANFLVGIRVKKLFTAGLVNL